MTFKILIAFINSDMFSVGGMDDKGDAKKRTSRDLLIRGAHSPVPLSSKTNLEPDCNN